LCGRDPGLNGLVGFLKPKTFRLQHVPSRNFAARIVGQVRALSAGIAVGSFDKNKTADRRSGLPSKSKVWMS
jgi:hypothetical protein